MVQFDANDALPMSDFAFAWRITDPKWASLPEAILRRIQPLSDARSKQVFAKSALFARQGRPFDPERYHKVANMPLEETEPVKAWLRALPVAQREQIYVCWLVADEAAAAIMDWGTFTEIWEDLWYPFDRVCVFDESLAWGFLLGPEEQAEFIQAGPVNSRIAKTDSACGESLVDPAHTRS